MQYTELAAIAFIASVLSGMSGGAGGMISEIQWAGHIGRFFYEVSKRKEFDR